MKNVLSTSLAVLVLSLTIHAEKLVIRGSDTLGDKLVPQLSTAFKAQYPDVSFDITAEGSTTGIAAIIDGSADIGMASRRAKSVEVAAATAGGVDMTPTVVAFDGIALIVNASNPLSNLTLLQVQSIFTGDVTDWSGVGGTPGPIAVYTRNTSSGTYTEFKEMAMKRRDYAGGVQEMAGNEQIVAEVAKNPSGIGYVGIAYTNAPGIKVLQIDGVTLSPTTVQNHIWPLFRPTFFYTNGVPKGLVKQFIDFTLSDAGSAIISQVGFVPLPKLTTTPDSTSSTALSPAPGPVSPTVPPVAPPATPATPTAPLNTGTTAP